MIPEGLIEKLRSEYGDEYLDTLATHYPKQFEHIVKVTTYYLLTTNAS